MKKIKDLRLSEVESIIESFEMIFKFINLYLILILVLMLWHIPRGDYIVGIYFIITLYLIIMVNVLKSRLFKLISHSKTEELKLKHGLK